MANQTCVLVDTCVLLEDPDVLVRIRQRGGLPFLTSTVLDELDFNKDANKRVKKPLSKAEEVRVAQNATNARMIFREFNRSPALKLTALPTGEPLLGTDVITQFPFRDAPVFLVGRNDFRSQSNNDAKIIELAQDYRMVLITRDAGMKVRAEALGVDVAFWTGPSAPNQQQSRQGSNGRHSVDRSQPLGQTNVVPNKVRPFLLCTNPIDEADTPISVDKIPGAGDPAKLGSGYEFVLGKLISAGGEGSIYDTQLAGQVCKIYHSNKLTKLKQRKVELMVSRKIDRPGVCWPSEIVTNSDGKFVGYLMPRANGLTMQTAMFVKPRLEKNFPKWNRADLVNVAGTFIDHISYLHSLNIIVGDINPMNLLVTEDSTKVWIVDTDSFQVEGFPCPVGTVNFTPTEIQGKSYSTFLRTKDHELFAVATMIFMILFPGKPPYSQQGGGSPAENIKSKNFPYRFFKDGAGDNPEVSGANAPQGTWQFIWANIPNALREAFFRTFREDKRVGIDEWTDLLLYYKDLLDRGHSTNELFPLGFKIRDPIQSICAKCSSSFTASQRWAEKIAAEGKQVWCPECANRMRLERLAAQSRRTTEQFTGQSASFARSKAQSATWRSPGQQKATTHTSNTSRPKPSSSQKSYSYSPPQSNNSGSLIGAIFKFFFK